MLRRTPLKRKTRISPVSKKRAKTAPTRRKLVAEQLERVPYCEASLIGIGCTFTAVDCHEIVPRGRRPNAHLDPTLFVSLCRNCHTWLTAHPDFATRHALMLHATATPDEVEKARHIRSEYRCPYPISLAHKCQIDHNDA